MNRVRLLAAAVCAVLAVGPAWLLQYPVTYSATNGYLRSSLTRTVRVVDRVALWAPNHQMVDVMATSGVFEDPANNTASATAIVRVERTQ